MAPLNRRVHVCLVDVADTAVSRRQKTCTLVAGELALSGTHAHTAVHPVRLQQLQGRAGPAVEDVLARVKEVRITFPRRPQEAFPSVSRRERR